MNEQSSSTQQDDEWTDFFDGPTVLGPLLPHDWERISVKPVVKGPVWSEPSTVYEKGTTVWACQYTREMEDEKTGEKFTVYTVGTVLQHGSRFSAKRYTTTTYSQLCYRNVWGDAHIGHGFYSLESAKAAARRKMDVAKGDKLRWNQVFPAPSN